MDETYAPGPLAVMCQGNLMKSNRERIALRVSVTMQCARRSGNVRLIAATLAKGIFLGLLAASFSAHPAFAANDVAPLDNPSRSLSAHQGAAVPATTASEPVLAYRAKRANFERERASQDARHVADWVVDSGDNRGLSFVIVDKTDAKVFVFHADGRLRGAAPALLGLAVGDDSVPGIGDRKLATIRPEERTTPAGRFVAALDHNLHGKEMLWVDYKAAISLHPVITSNVQEHRAERLATPTPLDNRISYGCINVPAEFFKNVVHPAFTGTSGIVYVLPETRSARQVFASYDVDERARLQTASQRLPAQVAAAAALH